MFLMHVVYGLDLIAVSMGAGLLMWSIKTPGKGSWIGKLFGSIVVILSIASIVCIYSCAMGGTCHRFVDGGEGVTSQVSSEPGHEMMKKIEHKK